MKRFYLLFIGIALVLFGMEARPAHKYWMWHVQPYISNYVMQHLYKDTSRMTATVYPKPSDPVGSTTRIYLIHGAHLTNAQWDEPVFQPIAHLDGQIIRISLPDPRGDMFSDGGAAHCPTFIRKMNRIDQELDKLYGKATKKIVIGMSWGGFHTLLAAHYLPWVTRYAALSPATKTDGLFESWWARNSRCGPFVTPPIKPGFIAYADHDERVNGTFITQLVQQYDIPSYATHSTSHVTTPDQVAAVIHSLKGYNDHD